MPNVFFTADTHFGHGRIIEYCKRPFADATEMNEAIITRCNEVVRTGDLLYHLGDVSWSTYDWRAWLDRLNTKQVYLIWGNHDCDRKKANHPSIVWAKEIASLQLPFNGASKRGVFLCHYAMRSWPSKMRGGYQLYGHSHGTLPGVGRQMDVGVDTNNFYPWAWEDVVARLEREDPGLE